ncbi:MAG TPA: hypothetical protein V6D35_00935 [Candidatus Sericytochromatia bacterium]
MNWKKSRLRREPQPNGVEPPLFPSMTLPALKGQGFSEVPMMIESDRQARGFFVKNQPFSPRQL